MKNVEAPTMAFPPEVMKMSEQVPAMAARGQTVPWHLARAHSDANPKPRSHDIKGSIQRPAKSMQHFRLLCPFYVCNDTCACCGTPAEDGFISTGWAGIPRLFAACFGGTCERDGNGWVTRDKHGVKTGEVLVLNEQGTHAYYSLKCAFEPLQRDAVLRGEESEPAAGQPSVPIEMGNAVRRELNRYNDVTHVAYKNFTERCQRSSSSVKTGDDVTSLDASPRLRSRWRRGSSRISS